RALLLFRSDERAGQRRSARGRRPPQQSGGEFAPAVSTTRTSDAAVSKYEDAAEVQLDSLPGPQPFQSGAPSRHPSSLQAETLCRIGRVARTCSVDRRSREGMSRYAPTKPRYFDNTFRRVVVENAAKFGGIAQLGEVGGDKILAAIGAHQRLPGAGLGVGGATEADQPFHAFARASGLIGDLGIAVGPARRRSQPGGAADQRGARLVAKRRGGIEVERPKVAEREFVALQHRLGVDLAARQFAHRFSRALLHEIDVARKEWHPEP